MSKPEIDKIGRIKLSDLKGLLQEAKKREDNIPLRYDFQLQERNYSAIYSASWSYILFRYVDKDGQTQEKRITLYLESSHLGRGLVTFFLCPYTGRKCRKLFCDGRVMASRYAFPHVYSYQNESRKGRALSYYSNTNNPERKGGKKTYRGELSRYGKRLLRYYERIEKREEKILNYLSFKPMGRPRKPQQKRIEL